MTSMNKYQKPLGEWAKSIQGRLNYEYELSKSILTQGALIGTIREHVIQDILSKFLPLSVEIGTGQIVDVNGDLSDQVDIILAKDNTPVFRFDGGVSAFIIETVLATIEVKSMMYREKLNQALENSRSVKGLSYILHTKTKGSQLFIEAFDWLETLGGLDELERKLSQPSLSNTFYCPDDIWDVMPFIQFWLHWVGGEFRNTEIFEKFPDLFNETEFDFFVNLLRFTLKENDSIKLLTTAQSRSEEIKGVFFEKLYEYLLYEHLPPATFILAYGGYQNIQSMLGDVRSWYLKNKASVTWYEMPRVIMNHKMLMYRRFNEYHCHEFEYPMLMFIQALSSIFNTSLFYPTSFGSTSLVPYFSLPRILGDEHPKLKNPSYCVWSIPLDGSSEDSIMTFDQLHQSDNSQCQNTHHQMYKKDKKVNSRSRRRKR